MTTNSRISGTSASVTATMVPSTPMRRFLGKLGLVRTLLSLEKRARDNQDRSFAMATAQLPKDEMNALDCAKKSTSSPSIHCEATEGSISGDALSSPPPPVERACVAIQQDDKPFDAIVITTLPCYPFCCHEDLLLMTRPQLLEVATTFNAHLPQVMTIEISDTVTDAQIRHRIERLVGIVPDIPNAPQRARSWADKRRRENSPPEGGFPSSRSPQQENFPSPPVSPLSLRTSRRRSFSLISTLPRKLECLEEEDEELEERPLKKRKVSGNKATPTRFLYEHTEVGMDISPNPQSEYSGNQQPSLRSPAMTLNPSKELIYRDTNVLSFQSSHLVDVEDIATRMDVC